VNVGKELVIEMEGRRDCGPNCDPVVGLADTPGLGLGGYSHPLLRAGRGRREIEGLLVRGCAFGEVTDEETSVVRYAQCQIVSDPRPRT